MISQQVHSPEVHIAFAEFMAHFGRSYTSKDDHSSRLDIFASNYAKI